MDATTVTFVLALVVAFVFLRWFVNSEEEPDFHAPRRTQNTNNTNNANNNPAAREDGQERNPPVVQHNGQRRPVTTDMIEIVQQLAPHVTEAQIRHDLLRSGSVEATVERILSQGTLPFPPNSRPSSSAATTATTTSAQTDARNMSKIQPENLLKKYGVDEKSSSSATGTSKKMEWSDSADQRSKTLAEKKAEMVLNARRRLEAQLSNQQDLSGLTKK